MRPIRTENRWRLDRILPDEIDDVLSVFEVWQNAFADAKNDRSDAIVARPLAWLIDVEDRYHADWRELDSGKWNGRRGPLGPLETRLRAIVLRAGRAYPDRLGIYLDRLTSQAALGSSAFKDVVAYTPVIADVAPSKLVGHTLQVLLNELPDVVAARPRHGGALSFIPAVSHHDWHTLGVNTDPRMFSAPSPIRQPFAGLLAVSPDDGRELARRLTNHAVTAWRQLHRLGIDFSGRPSRSLWISPGDSRPSGAIAASTGGFVA